MIASSRRSFLMAGAPLLLLPFASPARAQVDPSILGTINWDQLQWLQDPIDQGSWYAVVSGDLAGPGPYVIVNKIVAGNFNRPHSHPTSRQIYVIRGTWWVGQGMVVDPARAVPKAAGSFVQHPALDIHWDGTRGEEVMLLIGGIGPAVTNYVG